MTWPGHARLDASRFAVALAIVVGLAALSVFLLASAGSGHAAESGRGPFVTSALSVSPKAVPFKLVSMQQAKRDKTIGRCVRLRHGGLHADGACFDRDDAASGGDDGLCVPVAMISIANRPCVYPPLSDHHPRVGERFLPERPPRA